MTLEHGFSIKHPKIQSADLYCGICGVNFAHFSDFIRNIDGLAMHLDCMRTEKILNLREQLAAQRNMSGPRTGVEQVRTPTTRSMHNPNSYMQPVLPMAISSIKRKWEDYAGKENKDSQQELAVKQRRPEIRVGAGQFASANLSKKSRPRERPQPDSAARLHGWTKRKLVESTGEEEDHEYTSPDTPSDASPARKAKPNLHIIELSSSDDGLPLRAPPQTRTSVKKTQERRPITSNHFETQSLGSSGLESSGLELVGSAFKYEDPPSALTQKQPIDPRLCKEQQRLVNTIMTGKNVFYTGSAGCGKSTVLKNFVKRLKAQLIWKGGERKEHKQVDIIAPTGRAALDINGSTSWTYAGWNPDSMKKPLEKLKDAAEHGKWVRKRLRATDVLVIDEISMMENHHLERLNEIMQSARGDARAFGGVQLVVTGDFCQLPPVKPFVYCYKCGKGLLKSKADTLFTCPNGHGEWLDSEKWAFCSSAWEAAEFTHVNLTTIHRQNDRVFIDILQKCRLGIPFTPQEENLLLQHESQTGNAVKLFSTRQEVGAVNREAFNRLRSPQRTYNSYDDFRCHSSQLESKGRRSDYDGTLDALRDHRFDPRIDLKQGMVVVLLVNLDQENGLVNGSQGVVMGFEKAEDSKMPKAIKKDDKDFSRSGSGPVLTGEHAEVREANIRTFMEHAQQKVWPIVLFQNRVTRTIYADCRVTELGDEVPYSLISRTQIPLVAGWAMTVHKSQGMTLSRVVVNLSKSFEEGQMYVALSRARNLEGLKVEGLGRQQGCNERVRKFLREKLGVKVD